MVFRLTVWNYFNPNTNAPRAITPNIPFEKGEIVVLLGRIEAEDFVQYVFLTSKGPMLYPVEHPTLADKLTAHGWQKWKDR